MVNVLREAGAEVLGIVSIFTYGMQKGLDRLAAEELDASEKPSTCPPRLSMADSKLRRVRVDGSKNRVARPAHGLCPLRQQGSRPSKSD